MRLSAKIIASRTQRYPSTSTQAAQVAAGTGLADGHNGVRPVSVYRVSDWHPHRDTSDPAARADSCKPRQVNRISQRVR